MSYLNDPVESAWIQVGTAEEKEPRFVVNNLFAVGLNFINGEPKTYKSATLLSGCMSVLGLDAHVLPPDLRVAPEHGTVMGLTLEAEAGVLRHTSRVGFGTSIPDDAPFLVQDDPMMFRLDSPPDMQDLIGWLKRLKPKLFFVDPLRNAHSVEENDSGGMIGLLQPLQQYAVRNDMAVVCVHHSKKISDEKGNTRNARASDMRGSSALFGLADAVITQTKKGPGLIHMDAVFKRGEAWDRTIQLGIWGAQPTETVDSITKEIFGDIASGKTPVEICRDRHLSKAKVGNALEQLVRIGALDSGLNPTSASSTLVGNAVRRFASKGITP